MSRVPWPECLQKHRAECRGCVQRRPGQSDKPAAQPVTPGPTQTRNTQLPVTAAEGSAPRTPVSQGRGHGSLFSKCSVAQASLGLKAQLRHSASEHQENEPLVWFRERLRPPPSPRVLTRVSAPGRGTRRTNRRPARPKIIPSKQARGDPPACLLLKAPYFQNQIRDWKLFLCVPEAELPWNATTPFLCCPSGRKCADWRPSGGQMRPGPEGPPWPRRPRSARSGCRSS